MRIQKSLDDKSKDEKEKICQNMEKISHLIETYISNISNVQDEVSNALINEFGEIGSIDMNSIAKLARVTSRFANIHSSGSIREFPRTLQRCFDTWKKARLHIIFMTKTERKKYAIIPARLSFCLFYNGEIYKAVDCLINYTQIVKEDLCAKENVIRWLIYLGETELAEQKIKEWKMKESSSVLGNIVDLYIQYVKSRENRGDLVEQIKEIHEKIKSDGLAKKSFSVYILMSFSSWILSTLSHTAVSGKLEGKDLPDRSTNLIDAVNRIESVVRNRANGFGPYNFDNSALANIKLVFEKKKAMISPADYYELGSDLALMFELRREWALFNISVAQTRDAISAMILNWRVALRSSSFLRVLQSANNLLYYFILMEEPDSEENIKLMRATQVNMLNPQAMIVKCSTPIKENELKRAQTPLTGKKNENISNQDTMIMELTDQMTDLDLAAEQSFHIISKNCGCFVCSMYLINSSMASEYMFSSLLHYDFSQKAMLQFDAEFVEIRARAMKDQCSLFGDDQIRPRPPLLLNEIFGVCAIRWLAKKVENNEKTDTSTMCIIKNAQKIIRYVPLRTVELMITFAQILRQYQTPEQKTLSWMHPIDRRPFAKIGIECAKDILRAVSPFGRRQKIKCEKMENEQEKDEEKNFEKMKFEGKCEMIKYSHILYREWRAKAFKYGGRTSSEQWESAYFWIESTSIGSRNAVQQKLGKCRKGLVTMSGPDRLRKCAESMSPDMTLIQIAIGDDDNVYLIKLHSDRIPIIMPIAHRSQMIEMMDKFTHLLLEDEKIAKNPGNRTPEQFWSTRTAIDDRIRTLVEEIQSNFLDVAAYLLLPSEKVGRSVEVLAEKLERITKGRIRQGEAKELVYLTTKMKENEWVKLIERFCEMKDIDQSFASKITVAYQLCLTTMQEERVNDDNKKYTYLAICPEMSQFCWERLPIFDNHPYVCRTISIHAMFCQLETMENESKRVPLQIDVQKAYYVLDPENNLGDTKRRMMEYINKFQWEGTVGTVPEPLKVTDALEQKDAFFYFGHGSGSKVISRNTIKQSKCNAISLLMGCGSVKTIPQGIGFDGKSVLLDYALAKCPLVVGCLWTVTDGEIDRYLMRMIDDCFVRQCHLTGTNQLRQLTEAMQEARSKAKLKYLTGAAVVMYGWPVVSKPESLISSTSMEKMPRMIGKDVLAEALAAASIEGEEEKRKSEENVIEEKSKSPTRKMMATPPRTPKTQKNVLKVKQLKVFEDDDDKEKSCGRITRSRAAPQASINKTPVRSRKNVNS